MSSHHIVRDKQEPALIIANGESCSFELLGQLLEWSPTVVVLDGAVHRVQELGIKFDILLGDFDRLQDLEKIRREQYPLRVVHTPDQEATDLEKAILFLINEGYPAANIVWATGRRSDHTVNNLMSLLSFGDRIDLVMLDDYSRIMPLKKDFRKWYSKGTPISLIPFGRVEGVRTRGLKYNLNDEFLESTVRSGSSNEVVADGMVEISHRSGKMLLMECHD